jgi:2-keto-3-deoxy-L-fuconate dehydrogenase
MTGRLAGKTVLVTAAGQGIGRAIAQACILEGARVVATDLEPAKLAGLAGAVASPLDVTDEAAVRRLAAELGAVDALVNVAGYVHHGSILACDDADWDFSFALNVTGMFRVARAFLPAMVAAGGGAIVNMASVCSSLRGFADRCAYGASKAAVIGLTKSIAADFVGKGIRCNAIAPGTVESPSLEARIAAFADPAAARRAFIDRQPMGRLGKPEEVAQIAVHLASDEAAFTTGQIFVVDGGITI